MSLSELKRSGKVRPIPVDERQIANLLAISKRDLDVAASLLEKNLDWCFIASYNSMLQASRALLFSYGFSASEEEQHKTVVEFVKSILGENDLTQALDRMRRKRHEVTYDEAGAISRYEAEHALKTAERYLDAINKRIKERLGKR